ncbi:hypothetical protein B0J12DRAFT_701726 [Macrophomina phaseolina]|uniref:BTB domain-containing protein n=1 Tax=Macrophomina phaseolina TaxID=35725 RepID=A0ABQ8G3Z5_9PEZI|nr:hypothetical protein B0J12DRAFT_701726 [Macrophomina phaseolina]
MRARLISACRYYSSGLFSDLEIRASNGTGPAHRVHKLIVSAQCEFLADAINPLYSFKPPSQASQTNIVKLKHDQDIVRALLEYLYRFDYALPAEIGSSASADTGSPIPDTDGAQPSSSSSPSPSVIPLPPPPLLFHARLHAAAHFYGVPGLADLALARFVAGAAELWRMPAKLAVLRILLGRLLCSIDAASRWDK